MKRDILVNWLSKLKEVLQIQIFSQKLMDKKKKSVDILSFYKIKCYKMRKNVNSYGREHRIPWKANVYLSKKDICRLIAQKVFSLPIFPERKGRMLIKI